MSNTFKPGQAQKSASALNRVHETENVIKNGCVVRFLLELYELNVNNIETLVRLGNEFPEEVVHGLLSPDLLLVPHPETDVWTEKSM